MAWRSGRGLLCREEGVKRLDASATETEMQRAVLCLVLAEHPEAPTLLNVYDPLLADGCGFAEEFAVMSAVRDLAFVGLLCINGPYLYPTEAALRFYALAVSK